MRSVLRTPSSLKPILVPSVIAGVAFAAGMAVMPTTLLFAMIVALYTLIQYTWNAFHGKNTDYLLVVNGIVSVFAIAGLAIVGVHSPVYSLATYSAAPTHAFALLFFGTALLQAFSRCCREKTLGIRRNDHCRCDRMHRCSSPCEPHAGQFGVQCALLIFRAAFPGFPLDEQKPWALEQIWGSYNIGIILALAGLPLLAYRFWKRECPAHLFVLVWGVIVLISTIQHSRFEYYSAVIVVIAAASCPRVCLYSRYLRCREKGRRKTPPDRKGRKEPKKRESSSQEKFGKRMLSGLEGTGTSLVLACMVVFCGVSLLSDYSIATTTTKNTLIPPQWTEILEWVDSVAPGESVTYLGPYDGDNWTYPAGSYSILSWWDYGHWITYLSKRIPVTNPFQDNVGISSYYFFAESEVAANHIADRLDTRYIITDWKMADSKFPSMVAWYRNSVADNAVTDNYYYQEFRLPQKQGQTNQTRLSLKFQPYYQTMVSRLQNFDGTMVEPRDVVYIEYDIPATRSGHCGGVLVMKSLLSMQPGTILPCSNPLPMWAREPPS